MLAIFEPMMLASERSPTPCTAEEIPTKSSGAEVAKLASKKAVTNCERWSVREIVANACGNIFPDHNSARKAMIKMMSSINICDTSILT